MPHYPYLKVDRRSGFSVWIAKIINESGNVEYHAYLPSERAGRNCATLARKLRAQDDLNNYIDNLEQANTRLRGKLANVAIDK